MCREFNSDRESANGGKKDYINMHVGKQDGENVLQATNSLHHQFSSKIWGKVSFYLV